MKKNKIAIAVALCMAAVLTACGTPAKTETTKAAEAETTKAGTETTKAEAEAEAEAESSAAGGKLVMVTNAEFPPYEYHENNDIVGIDADIAKAIADKMGMELEIQDMAFDSLIPAVQSGKADFTAAGMTVNEDRKKNVDFTDTYAQAAQVIIVKEGSEIKTPADLDGKKIGVQTGTTGDIYAGDIKDAEINRYNKGMEAVMALTQGKIDAVVIDREPAKVFVKENAGLKILDEAFTEEEYAIAVKKGNTELLDKMNAAIKELKDSGELQKIVDKYITAE
ncbi:basic amino acid ABC transporter substrate-binding protein [Lacrimispora amygdalina]|uniref:basic amino acid ABC transporter substrate-binding protein n=1 Tax=Lacrimispora amygdalina TaxID=253257 RepID=UPI000BE2FFF0|nr:basic amino acid ABC transporter substrate-binding protein [Lacrimispora amygdalina]